MKWKIPLFKMCVTDTDVLAVKKVIERGSFWAAGPEMEEFETLLSQYMGKKYAVTFNSGTSALHALLLAYDIKDSDEVIVPSFTFVSTATSVLMVRAKPVFAEIEEQTCALDAEDVKKKITKNTKAIILVHYGGTPARDTIALHKLCEEKNILLLEDNAESMGAQINGQKVGTFGAASMLSFCQNKIISTGEGGAIITDNKLIYQKLKLIRSHGREEEQVDYFSNTGDNDYITIGYNWRMPTMNAALGISQLSHINELIDARREKAQQYKDLLKEVKRVSFVDDQDYVVYQLFTIILEDKASRDGLQKHLINKGIMCKPYFAPTHLKTLYKQRYEYKKGDLPITELLSDKVLSLPFYSNMPVEEIIEIVEEIKKYFL